MFKYSHKIDRSENRMTEKWLLSPWSQSSGNNEKRGYIISVGENSTF